MSERFPHSCSIGGTVTKQLFEELKAKVKESDWEASEIDLPNKHFSVSDWESSVNAYIGFLEWLEDHGLAYDYVCSGRDTFYGDQKKWRPGMRKVATSQVGIQDDLVLDVTRVLRMLDRRRCSPKKVAAFIRKNTLLDVPSLPPFVVAD